MKRQTFAIVSVLAAVIGLTIAQASAQTQTSKATVEEIRKELLQLPYFGVFDFLAFSYEKGTVTLEGYAYRGSLKSDAERAVKRVAGVETVNDRIEILPASQSDDELRWKAYYAIYREGILSHYAPGGGTLWGHTHPFFGGELLPLGPAQFPQLEPAGDYPIHIVVKQGRISLLGVVDSEADKTAAGIKVGNIPGSFGVDNQLTIDRPGSRGTAGGL